MIFSSEMLHFAMTTIVVQLLHNYKVRNSHLWSTSFMVVNTINILVINRM